MCAERNDVNQMQSFWIHEFLRVGLIIPWRVAWCRWWAGAALAVAVERVPPAAARRTV